MNTEHKIFAIFLLKRLAMADQTFQRSEQDYIDHAGQVLMIDQDTIDEITPDDYVERSLPALEQDRMTILYYALFLANSDNVVLSEEKEELRKIGFELGFRDEQVLQMLEVITKHGNKSFDPEELVSIIRSALN